jgi:ABC-type sugar transport system ATPase subunit
MATIKLESLVKRFGEVEAVRSLDLEIADGSFTVLLGPSGCGKTTTLNLIAGLEEPSGGRILFDDDEVQYVPVNKRDIAMVFQTYALYPNRSVRGNIEFGLKVRGVPKAEIATRVERAAAMVGLGELLERRPRQLSGGQQQRVALARRCSSSTSRSATSTRSCGRRCGSRSRACSRSSEARSST